MATERSKALPIFLAVAVIAAGAGYYFFKIYTPKQQKLAAQAEIDGWELRWKATRDCLLGPTPGSAKTSEALAIRELEPLPLAHRDHITTASPPQPARPSCTALIGKLNRGDEPDTGIKAVEAAWVDLDKAAGRAASAFGLHVAGEEIKGDRLPAALDDLDAARASLRAAAGMPAVEQTGAPLPVAQLVPVMDSPSLTVDTKPSSHGVIAFGTTKDHDVEVVLHTNGTPTVGVIDGLLRSVPDTSWGARVTADGQAVEIGTIDDKSAMATPVAQKLALPSIAAIVGSAQAGEVVYGNDKQFVVAHTAAGVTTLDPAVMTKASRAAIDTDGRVALIWLDDKQVVHGRILKPGADEPIVELGANEMGSMCLTNERAWVGTTKGMFAFGGAKPPVMRANPTYSLLGCTADAALFRSGDSFLLCTDDCRVAALPNAPELSIKTIVNNKLVALAAHDGVLGVWREDRQPVYYGLPAAVDPREGVMAMTDGKVIDILAHGAKATVVIRIPAN